MIRTARVCKFHSVIGELLEGGYLKNENEKEKKILGRRCALRFYAQRAQQQSASAMCTLRALLPLCITATGWKQVVVYLTYRQLEQGGGEQLLIAAAA